MLRPLKLGLVSVLVLGAAVGAAGCGGPSSAGGVVAARAASPPPADGSAVVRYELTGTAVAVDGNYTEPAAARENMVQLLGAPLPWTRTFTVARGELFVAALAAQGPNLDSEVTCVITSNGEVVARQTGPSVACHAEVAPV